MLKTIFFAIAVIMAMPVYAQDYLQAPGGGDTFQQPLGQSGDENKPGSEMNFGSSIQKMTPLEPPEMPQSSFANDQGEEPQPFAPMSQNSGFLGNGSIYGHPPRYR